MPSFFEQLYNAMERCERILVVASKVHAVLELGQWSVYITFVHNYASVYGFNF